MSEEREQEQEQESITVRNYKPTPFRQSSWEVVGTMEYALDFAPLEMEVIKSEEDFADPMFEEFDAHRLDLGNTGLHGEIGQPSGAEESVPNGIDPAVVEAQLQERFEEGRRLGHEEGYAQGQQEATQKIEQLNERMTELSSTILQEVQRFVQRAEKEAVRLALAVAKKILITTADVKPEYIVDVLRDGMSKLGAAKPLRIRVSPQDMEFLEVVGLPPELSTDELGVQYVADESVKSGCVIETDFGEIDLELEKMWQQISADLYEVYK